eukprot:1142378-Pelagomonas_calceolata.AAC.3
MSAMASWTVFQNDAVLKLSALLVETFFELCTRLCMLVPCRVTVCDPVILTVDTSELSSRLSVDIYTSL